jgi:hypothetical protein
VLSTFRRFAVGPSPRIIRDIADGHDGMCAAPAQHFVENHFVGSNPETATPARHGSITAPVVLLRLRTSPARDHIDWVT